MHENDGRPRPRIDSETILEANDAWDQDKENQDATFVSNERLPEFENGPRTVDHGRRAATDS